MSLVLGLVKLREKGSAVPTRRRARRQSATDPIATSVLLLALLGWFVSQTIHLPWRWVVVALVVLISCGLYFGRTARLRAQRQKEERLLLANVFSLSPTEFELRIQQLLTYLGWEQVQHRGGAGDRGVDLQGVRNGERCIVQCKLYRDLVPPEFLRALEGARTHEHADRAILVTTGRIAQQGRAWIQGKPIEIWDGAHLAGLFHAQRTAAADPLHGQHARRRTLRFIGILLGVNLLAVTAALTTPTTEHVIEGPPSLAPASAAPSALPSAPPVAVVDRSTHPASPAPRLATCGVRKVSGVQHLLLRSAPGRSATELDAYPAGTRVTLLCADPVMVDGIPWRNVQIGGVEGWMSGNFLK